MKILAIGLVLSSLVAALSSAAYAAGSEIENDALAINKSPTSLSQAIAAAEKHINGKAVRAEYEQSKKGYVFEVEVVAGTRVFDVKVDPDKGNVLSSAEDKADREHDHKRR